MKKQALLIGLSCALLMPNINGMVVGDETFTPEQLRTMREDNKIGRIFIFSVLGSLFLTKLAVQPTSAELCTHVQLNDGWQRCDDCSGIESIAEREAIDRRFIGHVRRLSKLAGTYSHSHELIRDNADLNATHACETYNPAAEDISPEEAERLYINHYCQNRHDLPRGAPFEKISAEVIDECFDVDEKGNWHYKPTPESLITRMVKSIREALMPTQVTHERHDGVTYAGEQYPELHNIFLVQ